MNVHVSVVHVMSGLTFFVKGLGSLAPNTNVVRVAESIATACKGVVATAGRVVKRNAYIDARVETTVLVTRPLMVRSENGFGAGTGTGTGSAASSGSSTMTDASALEEDVNLRTPNTENAVEKRVK